DIAIGIVAPDGRQGMVEHAEQFASLGIPFIFDPGQGLPMFDAADLDRFVAQAKWVAVNDYEWQLLQQKTGWTVRDLTQRVEALIVTRGHKGSIIYTQDGQLDIPCAQAAAVVDPTGCGDAYRAGLLHGFLHDLDYETTGRVASVMGALKIESRGTQNHHATPAQLERRLAESFGDAAAAKAALSARA
ncbi:MAG TPA: PfkB family carbohydrate kinase, partial [Steroidobacteraceae bacterium]